MISERLLEQGARLILRGMGVNLKDENFQDTPARVARMYREMLTPSKNSMTTFPSTYGNMVVLRGHRVWILCPHHLQPAEVTCHVAYIPRDKILGLSKSNLGYFKKY